MSLEDKERLLKKFEGLNTPMDKFSYLIKKSANYNELKKSERLEKFKVKGCNSQLWLYPEAKDGLIFFRVDSDASIPKGIAVILAEVYSGMSFSEVLKTPPTLFKELGLEEHLSMTRRNGLTYLFKQIYLYAQVFQSLKKS